MAQEDRLIDAYLDLMKKALSASLYEESAWVMIEPPKLKLSSLKNPLHFSRDLLKYFVVNTIRRKSMYIIKPISFDAAKRDEGKDWPLIAYTMIGHKRLDNVQKCFEDVLKNNIPGDLIETGAWRGGTTIFMRAMLRAYGITDRKVWVADSFEGLPRPVNSDDGWDLSQVDYLKVSLEQVQSNFEKFGLLDEQVQFIKGWFSDTLPTAPIEKLAILRLDGDMYSSTMDSLKNLYYKVSIGGYIIADDYY